MADEIGVVVSRIAGHFVAEPGRVLIAVEVTLPAVGSATERAPSIAADAILPLDFLARSSLLGQARPTSGVR
jgi:hypothetical protein